MNKQELQDLKELISQQQAQLKEALEFRSFVIGEVTATYDMVSNHVDIRITQLKPTTITALAAWIEERSFVPDPGL